MHYQPSIKAVLDRPEDFTAEEIQNALAQANARFLGEEIEESDDENNENGD